MHNNKSEHSPLKTSGTTGIPKEIFQPERKLNASSKVSIETQYITKRSRILTVCNMKHAGGLLAQTQPAFDIGACVDIVKFNPYTFCKDILGYSHTHLVPSHIDMLLGTKCFYEEDFTGLWVTCGSDRVYKKHIKTFTDRGATFMTNWGMTEVGPIAINHVFKDSDEVDTVIDWDDSNGDTLLGTNIHCDIDIIDGELLVRGDICVHPLWINTGDLVEMREGKLIFKGRK